jgi:3-hydroxyisobutyrate dehydrogenase-like beta-hydroxyacid dehydrogenase
MENAEQAEDFREPEERVSSSPAVRTAGVIGLGTMGSGIAARLMAQGLEVHGWNRTRSKAEQLIAGGLVWHDTPREVAEAVDVVISMVTDDTALRAVVAGPDGILSGLRPDQLYIDMSSVGPSASRAVADQARRRGAMMVDAPVSGSVPQVSSGSLSIMVGGDEPSFRQAEPVLRLLGSEVTHVGDSGSGLLLKLAINISLAVQALAFSEGLLLAERGGIDRALAVQVMTTSPIGSPMLRARTPLFVDPGDTVWFSIDLMSKDLKLALAEGAGTGEAMDFAYTAARRLIEAQQRGYGGADIAALHDVLATRDARAA